MRRVSLSLAVALSLHASGPATAQEPPLPAGSAERWIKLGDVAMQIFTYRPACREPSLLLVFHGKGRHADRYRDHTRQLADRQCHIVIAPQFDEETYPRWRYQHGGIVHKGVVQDEVRWTGIIIPKIVDHVRALEGRMMPYSLMGHSAGAQFLSRVAAFVPLKPERIVLANPGTLVFPDLRAQAPYGFAGVYPNNVALEQLRRYLAEPVTIYLGKDDVGHDDLNEGAEARAQGLTRHERGVNAFNAAKQLAQEQRWTFNWRLVEVPGVGHRAPRMLAAKEAAEALRP